MNLTIQERKYIINLIKYDLEITRNLLADDVDNRIWAEHIETAENTLNKLEDQAI